MHTANSKRSAHLHVLSDQLLLHLLLNIQKLQLLPGQPFPSSLQTTSMETEGPAPPSNPNPQVACASRRRDTQTGYNSSCTSR